VAEIVVHDGDEDGTTKIADSLRRWLRRVSLRDMARSLGLVTAFALVCLVRVAGQPPTDLPTVEAPWMTYLGSFEVPSSDGTCRDTGDDKRGCLDFGGDAMGIGPVVDGKSTLYIGGHDWTDQICQITIPALGERAEIVGPCQTITNYRKVSPDATNSGGGWVLGGSLLYNERTIVSAFGFYDANGTGSYSHFVSAPGAGIAGLTGPPLTVGKRSQIKQGWVAGYMATIPPEWRALLGSPALTGLCCTSIISRSSFGPAVGGFDPALLDKVNPVPWTPFVYYPDVDNALGPYDGPSQLFNGSTMIRGVAFPRATRSVLFIGRQGTGEWCYGTGTDNKSLHQTLHPQGSRWCYDPTNSNKGDHAYPYHHQVWAYDARDLLLVKQGKRDPWEIKPYATWTFQGLPSGARQGATIASATYDDSTRRLYVTETYNSSPRVHVFQIASAAP